MINSKYILCSILVAVICLSGCKEVYTPPVTKNSTNLLVIDGIVISGYDSSIITLSRTRALVDSAPSVKELGAQVSVVGVSGVEYPFIEQGNGRYVIDQLLLNGTVQYQLKVRTADGNEFRSELSSVLTSPPIDSVYWAQDSTNSVNIYLNTHDPLNNTHYYRWEYVETWEYRSAYQSVIEYTGPPGEYIPRGFDNQIFRCYRETPSSVIDVTSTTRLSSDIVNKYEVTSVPAGSEKISVLYSDYIKQYAISAEAYNFWLNLKKNTEQLGSLFDLQPFTELGNMKCVNDPGIKCIGFTSFTTQQTKRIFISKNEVFNWGYYPYYGQCDVITAPADQIDGYFQPPGGPYFNSLIGTSNLNYLVSGVLCVDCTYHGGSNQKPGYWP